jgi:hypothetical protein
MAAYSKFNAFVADVCNKVHSCASDAFKVMLTNTAPAATNAIKTDITEISAGNGYTAGGATAGGNTSSQTSGTETFALNNVTFTASGGTIGPFRYVVLYNSTPANGNLVAFWDYGVNLTLNPGDTFTVQFNGGASSGTVFTMT